MPEITPCPRCGRKIRVADELLGKKIRCPKCGETFVVKAPEEQLEVVSESPGRTGRGSRERLEEEPRARRRRDDEGDQDDEGLRRARRPPRRAWLVGSARAAASG